MKDGLIGHQGTMKAIGAKDPDLMSTWNISIKEITESEPESEDETKTAEERKKLVRQVSQTDEAKLKGKYLYHFKGGFSSGLDGASAV